ncbi:pectate lyase family protein [Kaistella palustris]|uniref:pectate lyase family protein n=1 Tax=Kaistella palustris TaxID=493376 RepID=UPI00040866CB|nr:pectate lyase [Kaistella palustris]
MKKYILTAATLLFAAFSSAQNYYLPAPEGFGAATTGGGDSTPVTVSTYTALKSNLTSAGSKVILVSGEITVPSGQMISAVISNKSIIGLPGARLINENQTTGAGILYLKPGSSNIIIRNLVFVGPGAYDIDGKDNLTADGVSRLWVDHCEFQDGQDGNFDIKGLSDNISVSWCKFTYLKPPVAGGSGGSNDHRFSNLVGSGPTDAPGDGHYSITFQNCYWAEGIKGRMPRARNAELHILSSYFNTSVAGAVAIGLGGGINNTTCYVENSNFAKVKTVYQGYPGDGGTVAIEFVNSMGGVSNIGTVPKPTYSTTPIPVAEVAQFLTDPTCGAGASLLITADGVVSPSACTNLGTQASQKAGMKKLTATLQQDVLFLNFPKGIKGVANVKIFSALGQTVKSAEMDLSKSSAVQLNVGALDCGVYYISAQAATDSFSGKFLKH